MEPIIGLILLLPGLTTATLGVGWLTGLRFSERLIARLTGSCYSLATGLVVILAGWMVSHNLQSVRLPIGNWFEVHTYRFPLLLQIDRLSLPLITLSVTLVGVIGAFSQRYMHREGGYLRFFFLLNLFGFGVLLLFLAGSFDLMIAGWELVGLTSVLLIGFFQQRSNPVRSALRVFLIYRVCDIGLLTGVAMLHHYVGAATVDRVFTHPWPDGASLLTGGQATVVGLLFLLAAMGKSAQVPFSGWLPQAMVADAIECDLLRSTLRARGSVSVTACPALDRVIPDRLGDRSHCRTADGDSRNDGRPGHGGCQDVDRLRLPGAVGSDLCGDWCWIGMDGPAPPLGSHRRSYPAISAGTFDASRPSPALLGGGRGTDGDRGIL